jgi:ornithine decarboxylase
MDGVVSTSSNFECYDNVKASGHLADLLREKKVFLGGSSFGKGLKRAARYYLSERAANKEKPDYFSLAGAKDLNIDMEFNPGMEEAFYVLDIGVLVSQVYQWRKFFPRVEPFYAVKCNPDPVIIRTLAILGCNFDCASRTEIRQVQEVTKDLPRKPEIIYANPCKAPAHLLEAVCKGVRMVTFDNVAEIQKCAAISKSIKLILRIITDDRGAQCRLSSKFGAPRAKWRPLLANAKKHGLQVVGVSFHVGSGCRDATRYEAALMDAREIFDMAKSEFGFELTILDIGGGFPGETHSMWNPDQLDPSDEEEEEEEEDPVNDEKEGAKSDEEIKDDDQFMYFTEIAEQVAPCIDKLFPIESGVRVIGEPGRYFVAACATLCCSVVSTRSNEYDSKLFEPEAIDDKEAADALHVLSREDQSERVRKRGMSISDESNDILNAIADGLADYSKLYAHQNLAQQEADVYNDSLDLFNEGLQTAGDLLGLPTDSQKQKQQHTVEGMNYSLATAEDSGDPSALLTLAAAGEAAVNGVFLQAMADSAPLQDDYAYYINDGVYGAFNNIMFDHASVRPRVLQGGGKTVVKKLHGFSTLESSVGYSEVFTSKELYASTVFGPTCDSIDVIARSVLLPRLKVGDWMYFQNMGAYTMAASSSFNGFTPSEKLYVCSVKLEYFEELLAGPDGQEEEKKEEEL